MEDNDNVALRVCLRGSHTGEPYLHTHKRAGTKTLPNNKVAIFTSIFIFKFSNDKIIEIYQEWDRANLHYQLDWPMPDCIWAELKHPERVPLSATLKELPQGFGAQRRGVTRKVGPLTESPKPEEEGEVTGPEGLSAEGKGTEPSGIPSVPPKEIGKPSGLEQETFKPELGEKGKGMKPGKKGLPQGIGKPSGLMQETCKPELGEIGKETGPGKEGLPEELGKPSGLETGMP